MYYDFFNFFNISLFWKKYLKKNPAIAAIISCDRGND
jgi:hypothetical protein